MSRKLRSELCEMPVRPLEILDSLASFCYPSIFTADSFHLGCLRHDTAPGDLTARVAGDIGQATFEWKTVKPSEHPNFDRASLLGRVTERHPECPAVCTGARPNERGRIWRYRTWTLRIPSF